MLTLQTVRYTGYSDSVFSSGNPKFHDKVNAWVLYEIEDEIEANKTYTLHNYALIPAVAPSVLDGCGIISTMYQVTVRFGFFLTGDGCDDVEMEGGGGGSDGDTDDDSNGIALYGMKRGIHNDDDHHDDGGGEWMVIVR